MHTQPLLDGYSSSSDSKSLNGTGYSCNLTSHSLFNGHSNNSLKIQPLSRQVTESPTIVSIHEEKADIPFIQLPAALPPIGSTPDRTPPIGNFTPEPHGSTPPTAVKKANLTYSGAITTSKQTEEKNNLHAVREKLQEQFSNLFDYGTTQVTDWKVIPGEASIDAEKRLIKALKEDKQENLVNEILKLRLELFQIQQTLSSLPTPSTQQGHTPQHCFQVMTPEEDHKLDISIKTNEPLLNPQEAERDHALLTEQERETLAFYIYQNTQDKIAPLSGKERCIFLLVVLFALVSAVNCKDFGDKFVRGLKDLSASFNASEELTQTIVSWCITASYFLAQFSLSANSLLTILTRFTRYCVSPIAPTEEQANSVIALLKKFKNYTIRKNFIIDTAEKPLTWGEVLAYVVVAPSVFPSGRFGYEAMHDAYGAPEAVARLGNLRTPAATAVNINFTKNFMEKRRPESDYPIIELYHSAKAHLKMLALNKQQGHAEEFIKLLNEGLLQHLTAPTSASEEGGRLFQNKMETIIDQLLKFTPAPLYDAYSTEKSCCPARSDIATYLSVFISILVSLTNFKGGTIVPKEAGITMPKDLWEFFGKINDQSATIIAATLIGAIFFGLPSWFVNTVINATSCKALFTSLGNLCSDIHEEVLTSKKNKGYKGCLGHMKAIPFGLGSYLKLYCGKEGLYVIAAACGGIGYGFGNGGAGYKYPPVENRPIPLINMSLSTIVYSALGYVSISALINTLRNGADQELLQRALDKVKKPTPENNLETYFNSLGAPISDYHTPAARKLSKKQSNLITLLLQIVEKALDAQIDSFKRLKPEYVESLMSEDQQTRVKARANTELNIITIDDFQTPEFEGTVVGPGTDSPAVEMQPINGHVPTRSRNDSPTHGNYTFFIHHPTGNKERVGQAPRRGSAFNSLPSGYDNTRIIPRRFPTDSPTRSPIITQSHHVIDMPTDLDLNLRPQGA